VETLSFETGSSAGGGQLVRRRRGGAGPAVVLLTAIAGINPYFERIANSLADHGATTLTVDYFARTGERPDLSGPEQIMAAVAALSDSQAIADVQSAVDRLRGLDAVDGDRIAVLGFCIGGTYALMSTSRVEGLKTAVAFYGVLRYGQLSDNKPVSPLEAVDAERVPLLAHYGDEDHLVPRQDVDELRVRTRGQAAEVYLYPGAGHAFHEDFRPPLYRPVAAKLAWERTLAHLDWHLGEG